MRITFWRISRILSVWLTFPDPWVRHWCSEFILLFAKRCDRRKSRDIHFLISEYRLQGAKRPWLQRRERRSLMAYLCWTLLSTLFEQWLILSLRMTDLLWSCIQLLHGSCSRSKKWTKRENKRLSGWLLLLIRKIPPIFGTVSSKQSKSSTLTLLQGGVVETLNAMILFHLPFSFQRSYVSCSSAYWRTAQRWASAWNSAHAQKI